MKKYNDSNTTTNNNNKSDNENYCARTDYQDNNCVEQF